MGEVIQLQGDQRKDVQEFLVDKKEGLALDAKTIKVCLQSYAALLRTYLLGIGPRLLILIVECPRRPWHGLIGAFLTSSRAMLSPSL